MKLYYDPITTTSRPLLMFAAEHDLPSELEQVSLFAGEHRTPEFLALNPNGCVPVLVDGDFVLTESAAILQYLADRIDSPLYPRNLRERARINAAMGWFSTNFHHAIGHQLAYPTLFPESFPMSGAAFAELTFAGTAAATRWLTVLDANMIGPRRNHVAGPIVTIADFYGASFVMLAEAIDLDLTAYPNVRRWLRGMKARPSWDESYAAFYGLISALRPAAVATG